MNPSTQTGAAVRLTFQPFEHPPEIGVLLSGAPPNVRQALSQYLDLLLENMNVNRQRLVELANCTMENLEHQRDSLMATLDSRKDADARKAGNELIAKLRQRPGSPS